MKIYKKCLETTKKLNDMGIENNNHYFYKLTSMDQKHFEELLISNYQGNSSQLSQIVTEIIEEKQNITGFFQLSITTLFTTENPLVRKLAMIIITNILYQQSNIIDSFDEKWRDNFLANLVTFYQNDSYFILSDDDNPSKNSIPPIDNEILYLFSHLFSSYLLAIKSQIQPLFTMVGDELASLEPPDPMTFLYLKNLTFRISVLYSILHIIDFSDQNMTFHYSTIIAVLLRALQHYQTNFDLAVRSIYILAYFLDFYPEEEQSVEEHIQLILDIADQSDQLESSQFYSLWGNIDALLHSEFALSNQDFVLRFHPSIFKACNMTTIPVELKIIPLKAMWSIPGDYDREVVHEICNLSLKLEREYVDQIHEMPTEILDIFRSIFKTFQYDSIYTFARGQIKECLESGSETDKVVALSILIFLTSNLPNKAYVDFDEISQLMIESLSSDNDLIVQAGCNLASSCLFGIATNLISSDELIPSLAQVLVHPNHDCRFVAGQAMSQIVRGVRCPIPGISLMLFNLIPKIPMNDIFPFLLLLSKSIKRDSYLKDELAEHFANFTLAMLNYDVNTDPFNAKLLVSGSCNVSLSLMSMNHTTIPILLNKTIENMTVLLGMPNIPSCFSFGLLLLKNFMKVLPEEATKIYTSCSEQISIFLEINDTDYENEKRNCVIYLSKIESLVDSTNHLFAQQLLEIASKWIVSDNPSYVGSGIAAIKKLLPILSEQSKLDIFKTIHLIIRNSKERDVVIICSKTLTKFLRNSDGELLAEMAKLGYEICIAYIKGELQILFNVPPLGNDIDLMIFYGLSTLLSELLRVPCDEIRGFVQFAFTIVEQNNHHFETDIILMMLSSGIKYGSFNQEEIQKISQLALSFFIDDIPTELMYNELSILISLVDKKLLGWDIFESKIRTIENWWNFCCSNKEKMKTAQVQLVILIWKVTFCFDLYQKIPELLAQTFIQFPPDDIKQTKHMIQLAKEFWSAGMFNNELVMPVICKRIIKILMFDPMVLKRRGVTDESLQFCKEILHEACNKSPEIQQFVNNYGNSNEKRKMILHDFIHL